MNSWLYLLTAVVLVFMIRIVIWFKLLQLTGAARKLAMEGQGLIDLHGNTVGELQTAGVHEQLKKLEAESGKLYRAAVPLAAVLCWFPLFHWVKKPFMLKAYDKAGYFKGQMGSHEAWDDVRRAHANDTRYYYTKHMMGLLASLRTATPLF